MPKQRLVRKDFPWSSNLAYAVGLIATDGNLSPDKRHISLTSCDLNLGKIFAKCLNKSNKPTLNPPSTISRKTCYRVQIGDVVLYNWLLRIGLTPNKSLSIKKIDIDYKYFPDFLRGNIDGDGSIIYYKDKYHTLINTNYVYDRLFVYFLSASKKYILWIQKTIQTIIKISGSVQTKGLSKNAKRDRQMYLLKFSTKEAKILLNYVYYKKNLPYLKRKYLIAKPFLNFNI